MLQAVAMHAAVNNKPGILHPWRAPLNRAGALHCCALLDVDRRAVIDGVKQSTLHEGVLQVCCVGACVAHGGAVGGPARVLDTRRLLGRSNHGESVLGATQGPSAPAASPLACHALVAAAVHGSDAVLPCAVCQNRLTRDNKARLQQFMAITGGRCAFHQLSITLRSQAGTWVLTPLHACVLHVQ